MGNVSSVPGTYSPEEQDAIMQDYITVAQSEFQQRAEAMAPQFECDLSSFEFVRTIGTGSFGRVLLAKEKSQEAPVALKILEKSKVIKLKQVEHTLNERNILATVTCPFIVNLVSYFKDNSNLYLVMEYVNGGELFSHLRRVQRYSEEQSRFYAMQIVLAFEYLQSLNIVYRDLKPENLLFAPNGYIKITDFGFAKVLTSRTWTLCGTPEYLAPEMILMKGYSKPVDWWALGVLIYEMCAGYPPFYADIPFKIYEKIVMGKYRISSRFTPELVEVFQALLQPDLTRRLGALKNGAADVKNLAWFAGADWIALYHQTLPASYVPIVEDPMDASQFDRYPEEPIEVADEPQFEDVFESF
eukprot:m.203019 g.203019  ORF g.203019 m.203019 type:complete len:357 (+) comp14985_c0_seq2:370-1440(+)